MVAGPRSLVEYHCRLALRLRARTQSIALCRPTPRLFTMEEAATAKTGSGCSAGLCFTTGTVFAIEEACLVKQGTACFLSSCGSSGILFFLLRFSNESLGGCYLTIFAMVFVLIRKVQF